MNRDALDLQPIWLNSQCPRMGRYVLGPLLGRGGMGEVVEAWDVVLHRTVALKLLKGMEPTAVIRFMHEAQVQARVVHPNICRIYDVDASDGKVKIAMQLVRGLNLEQARPDLSLRDVVTLMAQVAEGVHAAHRLKLIHRDLKPSNILLERGEDGIWIPYICDFGLAMTLDEPSMTASNGVIGTPAYMAPEQFRGDRKQIGPATDIYCLGGTLHFMLLGRGPLGATVTIGSGKRNSFQLPLPGDLPRDLKNILLKCLQPNPDFRYSSASSLAEDLWSFLNGEKIDATLPGPLGMAWRKVRAPLKAGLPYVLGIGGVLAGAGSVMLHLERVHARQAELISFFAQDSQNLEKDFCMERALPVHDMRASYARVHSHLEALFSELKALGPEAAGPGHAALARTLLLLRDYSGAQAEAEKARAAGSKGAEGSRLLATALASEAALNQGVPPDLRSLVDLFRQGQGLAGDAGPFSEALVSYLQMDFHKAANQAQTAFQLHPWQGESAELAALSFCDLARISIENGDPEGAEATFRAALSTADRFAATVQSDELTHHAALLTARGLAALQLDQGVLPLDFLTAQELRCDQALRINPANPDLQDDWLGLRLLMALRLRDLGRDPGKELDAAMIFQGTRLKEPLTLALRVDRSALLWLQAERSHSRGEDAFPALQEALKNAPPPSPARNLRAEILVFKARLEAERGLDPNPTLTLAQQSLQSQLQSHPRFALAQTAAEVCLVQAEWAAGHRKDAWESLKKAESLIDGALQTNYSSSAGFALSGLTRVLEADLSPGREAGLLLVARERLRRSEALSPVGQLQDRLRTALRTR